MSRSKQDFFQWSRPRPRMSDWEITSDMLDIVRDWAGPFTPHDVESLRLLAPTCWGMWPHTHQTTCKFAEKLASGMPAPAFICLILKKAGLQTATNGCILRPFFLSVQVNVVRGRNHRIIQLTLPFLLHKRNIKRQTKQKHNKMALLVWAAQRKPFIRSDRDANKLVKKVWTIALQVDLRCTPTFLLVLLKMFSQGQNQSNLQCS